MEQPYKKNQEQSQGSVFDESDYQVPGFQDPSEAERNFVQEGSLNETIDTEKAIFSTEEHKPIEFMFILFNSYKLSLDKTCKDSQCKLIFGMNLYKIEGSEESSFEICRETILAFVKGINYIELGKTAFFEKSKGIRMILSPYFINQFKKQGIEMIRFNNVIYIHSKSLNDKQLDAAQQKILQNGWLFPVTFRNHLKQDNENGYREIVAFLKKAIAYYGDRFKQRKITVEINTTKSSVNVISPTQRDSMIGKNTVKNIIESMICYIFKDLALSPKDKAILEKYLEKLSKYPIHFGKGNGNEYFIITKDTIMHQFISKPKFVELCKMTSRTEFGFLLLNSFNRVAKMDSVNYACKQLGYTMIFNNFQRFFRKTFVSSKQENPINDSIQLLARIAETLNERKEKYDIISREEAANNRFSANSSDDNLYYVFLSGKEFDEEISAKLNRDVMSEKIQIKKNFAIQYNLCEEEESDRVFWVQDATSQVKTEVCQEKVTKGKFFFGKRKVKGKETLYNPECLLTVI